MNTRLAIFTSHPIQYQAPWFREIARACDIDVRVFFGYEPDAQEQGKGFGEAFVWDIPLREGYDSTVLECRPVPFVKSRFLARRAVSIGRELDAFKPDVALVLGWQNFILVQAKLACARRGIPVIMRGESNAKKHRRPMVRAIHQAYLQGVSAVLAIGDSNAEFYREAGFPAERIATARYFIDNARFSASAAELAPRRQDLRDQWGIPADAMCALFAGKLEPKKRVFDVIEAVRIASAQTPRLHCLIAGSGEQMEEARRRAEGLPITFAGFLNQSRIVEAYAAADVLVLPSDFGETWGLVVNEGMASGRTAIVSARVGSADDLVRHEETGIVTPFADPAAIAQALVRLEGDRAELARLSAAATQRVTEGYSIDTALAGLRAAIAIARGTSGVTS